MERDDTYGFKDEAEQLFENIREQTEDIMEDVEHGDGLLFSAELFPENTRHRYVFSEFNEETAAMLGDFYDAMSIEERSNTDFIVCGVVNPMTERRIQRDFPYVDTEKEPIDRYDLGDAEERKGTGTSLIVKNRDEEKAAELANHLLDLYRDERDMNMYPFLSERDYALIQERKNLEGMLIRPTDIYQSNAMNFLHEHGEALFQRSVPMDGRKGEREIHVVVPEYDDVSKKVIQNMLWYANCIAGFHITIDAFESGRDGAPDMTDLAKELPELDRWNHTASEFGNFDLNLHVGQTMDSQEFVDRVARSRSCILLGNRRALDKAGRMPEVSSKFTVLPMELKDSVKDLYTADNVLYMDLLGEIDAREKQNSHDNSEYLRGSRFSIAAAAASAIGQDVRKRLDLSGASLTTEERSDLQNMWMISTEHPRWAKFLLYASTEATRGTDFKSRAWAYDPVRDNSAHRHNMLIPTEEVLLDKAEADKDLIGSSTEYAFYHDSSVEYLERTLEYTRQEAERIRDRNQREILKEYMKKVEKFTKSMQDARDRIATLNGTNGNDIRVTDDYKVVTETIGKANADMRDANTLTSGYMKNLETYREQAETRKREEKHISSRQRGSHDPRRL